MAEKHKSKYKAPKDLEKSQKPKVRKDLKDYTEDDKKGALNPRSTGEKQLNVLRKTDKEFVDTGDMYVKYNADDRLYKDLEDGEYDPKHAAKVLKKRQDKDENDNIKNIKDKLENLTREQREKFREQLLREYLRRKIVKILLEQPAPEAPEDEAAPEEDAPIDDTATEAPATATTAPAAGAPAPAPDDTMATPPAPAAEAPAAAPAATPAADPAAPEQQAVHTQKYIDSIKSDGTINQVNSLLKVSNSLTNETAIGDKIEFYKLLMNKSKSIYIKLISNKEKK